MTNKSTQTETSQGAPAQAGYGSIKAALRMVIDEASSLKEVGALFNGMTDKQRRFWNFNSVYGKYGHREPPRDDAMIAEELLKQYLITDLDIAEHQHMVRELALKNPILRMPAIKRATLAVARAFPILRTERYL